MHYDFCDISIHVTWVTIFHRLIFMSLSNCGPKVLISRLRTLGECRFQTPMVLVKPTSCRIAYALQQLQRPVDTSPFPTYFFAPPPPHIYFRPTSYVLTELSQSKQFLFCTDCKRCHWCVDADACIVWVYIYMYVFRSLYHRAFKILLFPDSYFRTEFRKYKHTKETTARRVTVTMELVHRSCMIVMLWTPFHGVQ